MSLGIDPAAAQAIATVVVEAGKAIAAKITRPRMDEDWAGQGEYEARFLFELSKTFPPDRYALINQNHPLLIDLYDSLVSYGKAQFPNKRGMVGAGVDMSETAANYVRDFIHDAGGANIFGFLYQDVVAEAQCMAEQKSIQKQISNIKIRRVLVPVAIVGTVIGVSIGGYYYVFRRSE